MTLVLDDDSQKSVALHLKAQCTSAAAICLHLRGAHQAAYLINALTIVAKCTRDVSLVGNNFEHLKRPGSFHACLMQLIFSMKDAFFESKSSVQLIQIYLLRLPDIMNQILRAMRHLNDSRNESIINDCAKEIEDIADQCEAEAETAHQKFDIALKIAQELSEAAKETEKTKGDRSKNLEQEVDSLKVTIEQKQNEAKNFIEKLKKQEEKKAETWGMYMSALNAKETVFDALENKIKSWLGSSSTSQVYFENTKELYEDAVRESRELDKEFLDAERKTAECMANLAKINVEKLDLTNIIENLSQGITQLAEITIAWQSLTYFFKAMKNIVTANLKHRLKNIGKESRAVEKVKINDMLVDCARACAVGNVIMKCFSLYDSITDDDVIPVFERATRSIALTVEEAKEQVKTMKVEMDKATKDVVKKIEDHNCDIEKDVQDVLKHQGFDIIKNAIEQ